MGKKYRTDRLAAVHETALGLTEAGVMDKRKPSQAKPSQAKPSQAKPNCVCPLPQRHHRARQPVGARRETSTRRFAQAAHAGGQEGTTGRCMSSSQ